MRSDEEDVANPLLLVAAVTWDLQQLAGGSSSSSSTTISERSKVKVYRNDLVFKNVGSSSLSAIASEEKEGKDEAVVVLTRPDLVGVIKRELQGLLLQEKEGIEEDDTNDKEDDPLEEKEYESLGIEIYDPIHSTYVNLLDEVGDDEDIVQRFGGNRRLRMAVTYHPKMNNTESRQQDESGNNSHGEFPAIMGRYYAYDASEGIEIDGKRLLVKEITNQENAGTGVNVWDGALLLARYLEKQPTMVQNKRILELGAGCGLVGIAAGVLGARDVIVTDLPYALPNMQNNIDSYYEGCVCESNNNPIPRIVCHPLDWYKDVPTWKQFASIVSKNNHNRDNSNATDNTEEVESIDSEWIPELILVADCVWMQELVEPLLNTIRNLMQRAILALASDASTTTTTTTATTKPPKILISYQRRGKSTHEDFWKGIHNIKVVNTTTTTAMKVTEIDVTTVGLTKPDVLHLLLLEAD